MRNYRADVDLEPTPAGTAIRWVSAFDPKVPGTGWLVRRALDGFIAQLTHGLAEHAASRTAGGSGSVADEFPPEPRSTDT